MTDTKSGEAGSCPDKWSHVSGGRRSGLGTLEVGLAVDLSAVHPESVSSGASFSKGTEPMFF